MRWPHNVFCSFLFYLFIDDDLWNFYALENYLTLHLLIFCLE